MKKVSIGHIVADFISSFDINSVPSGVIDLAHIAFIDTVGVMLAGSKDRASALACNMVRLEGGASTAGIFGQPLRVSPQLAAFANGVAAHALEFDLTYISGQSVASLIPAILALAESSNAKPSECVTAFIVGCEIASRIMRSCPKLSAGGWHTTGVIGTIASAAACSRLLKLRTEDISNSIGISVSMASGVTANYGTMTKALHAGLAARNGIVAALLGAQAFTAHPSALDAPDGFFHAFGRDPDIAYESFQDLGKRFDLLDPGYKVKAYPCGGLTHSAIEAALLLRDKVHSICDISAIRISVSARAARRIRGAYPQNVEAAKFSVRYLVPYAIINGAPRLSAFAEDALDDRKVQELSRILSVDDDVDLSGDSENPALLTIAMRDGRVFEERVDHVTGSFRKPMSQTAIIEKFLDCAKQVVNDTKAAKIVALLSTLATQSTFDDFWKLIVSD